jgi:hypothetical protein
LKLRENSLNKEEKKKKNIKMEIVEENKIKTENLESKTLSGGSAGGGGGSGKNAEMTTNPVTTATATSTSAEATPTTTSVGNPTATSSTFGTATTTTTTAENNSNNGTENETDPPTEPIELRDPLTRPCYRLSVRLIDTYKYINKVYYEAKARKIREQQGSNRVGLHNDGYDDQNYDYIIHGDEMFAERYIIKHRIGKVISSSFFLLLTNSFSPSLPQLGFIWSSCLCLR